MTPFKQGLGTAASRQAHQALRALAIAEGKGITERKMAALRASLSTHGGALVAQKIGIFLTYLETEVAGPFAFSRDT